MAVWALGLNHHTAPLDLRGRFAFAIDQIAPALHGLRQSHLRHPEAAILSTCNRTELYVLSQDEGAALHEWLAGGLKTSLTDMLGESGLAGRNIFRAGIRPLRRLRFESGQWTA